MTPTDAGRRLPHGSSEAGRTLRALQRPRSSSAGLPLAFALLAGAAIGTALLTEDSDAPSDGR